MKSGPTPAPLVANASVAEASTSEVPTLEVPSSQSPTPTGTEKRAGARWQHGVLWVLLCVGLGIALWPAGQAALGWWGQRTLRAEWQRQVALARSTPDVEPMPMANARSKSARLDEQGKKKQKSQRSQQKPRLRSAVAPVALAEAKWMPTRIVIPALKVDALVTRGVSEAALRRGPGHDPASALPGRKGNCVIAAHRNAYGWWFYRLNEMGMGERIELRTPRATYLYEVASTRVMLDTEVYVLRPPANPDASPRLTLYTCALPHGSRRIVVSARLTHTLPPSD